MEKEFRDMLRRHSQQQLPVATLEQLVREEGEGDPAIPTTEPLKIQNLPGNLGVALQDHTHYYIFQMTP